MATLTVNSDDPTALVTCGAAAQPPQGLVLEDCEAPVLNRGPIVNLYEFSEPFTAVNFTAAHIATLLANKPTTPGGTVTGPWGVGPLIAQVSYTPPTDGTPTRVNGVDYPAPADLSYAVVISNTSDEFYEFARTTQNGGRPGYYYGVDINGNWFGGYNGMANGRGRLKLRGTLPTEENALQTLNGTINGLGMYDDRRLPSPVPVVFG